MREDVVKILLNDSCIGKTLSNDVYKENFGLLVKEGTVLTSKHVERLLNYRVNYIFVQKV